MSDFLSMGAAAILLLTLPGSLYLLVLTLAACTKQEKLLSERVDVGRIAFVVPAHNEATGIARTVANLYEQAKVDGHADVVVIADNCNDLTADIAAAAGAKVLVRNNPAQPGKGYALDFAFQQLPEYAAYVVVDADSVVASNFLRCIRAHFLAGAQALQTRYTVLNGDHSPRTGLAEIALAAFNVLRPKAREQLHLSVGILGNGFALRRSVLQRVPYSASSVVEDLEYHLRLVEADIRVEFVDMTEVRADMPSGAQGHASQHARWQGGRLRMLREHGYALAKHLCQGHWRYLDPLLDLLLLPLAYHVVLLVLACLFASPLALLGLLLSLAIVLLHVLVAVHLAHLPWSRLWVLLRVPFYLAWKLCLLPKTLRNASRHSLWVRTNRHGG